MPLTGPCVTSWADAPQKFEHGAIVALRWFMRGNAPSTRKRWCSRHLLAMMPRVKLHEPRVVCDGHTAERRARHDSVGLRARAAFAIELRERVLETQARLARRRGSAGWIQGFVGFCFGKRAASQHAVEENAPHHGTKKERQVRELRRCSRDDVRRFVQRGGDVLHDLTRRPLPL